MAFTLSKNKLFIAILVTAGYLFSSSAKAQDITGVWKGTISTTDKELPYELAISDIDGKLSGYSYTRFTVNGKEMVAVKSIKVKNNNGDVTVVDDDLIYDEFVQSAARSIKQTSSLRFSQEGNLMTLAGDFKTHRTREFRVLSGKINVQKVDSVKQTEIAVKLDSLKLLKDLSFVQPKKPAVEQPLMIVAELKKITPQKNVSRPAMTFAVVNTKPSLQQNKTSRKIIIEKDEPVIAAVTTPPVQTAAPVTKPVSPPVAVAPKPTAPPVSKPVVTTTTPPVSKPVATTTAPPVVATTPPPAAKPPVKTTVTGADFTANLAKRSIENIETLDIKTDSLMLTLYDNGEVDGDTVSIILNGKMLMEKQGLSTNAINKTIYITPDMGDSIQLVMYADNLGSIPPNTGLLIIRDGRDRYEIRFSGDLRKNAGITLRRRKQ